MDLSNDTPNAIVKDMGIELSNFSDVYEELKPDILVVLGDRYEIMVSVLAATIYKIPIAHLCGGDITVGSYDDNFRHAITKMSHIHFVTNDDSKERVENLGEKNVFNYGNPGLEELKEYQPISKVDLEQKLDVKFKDKNILVIFHPTTLENHLEDDVVAITAALLDINEKHNPAIFFIAPNSDNNNHHIKAMFDHFTEPNAFVFLSLERSNYLSLMYHSDMMIGNSSSGIYEAPVLKTPSVNIGTRQTGRLKATSVIDCDPKKEDIIASIEKAFAMDRSKIRSLYPVLTTSSLIVDKLKTIDLKLEKY